MRTRHWLILGIAGLALLLTAGWIMVTQPMVPAGGHAAKSVVDPERLKGHVEMLSQRLVPRDWRHVENLDLAAVYISQQLVMAGSRVTDQRYQMRGNNEMRGKTHRNVIATLGPDTKERIVVGAHYDAYLEYPAADDNASGIAALIELARMLASDSLPMRVDLVAFSLEEPFAEGAQGNFRTPDGGSAVHATSLRAMGAQVRLMLSLETLGYFSEKKDSQEFPISLLRTWYPNEGNFITVVSNLQGMSVTRTVKAAMRAASPLPVCSMNAPSQVKGIDYSDHFNYWRNGYSAVMITDTALNRNKAYHTAGDIAERLDYMRMAMVVQGVHGAVLAVARL
jgi:Zn-dependent M28 family amino/carboxypeptidase